MKRYWPLLAIALMIGANQARSATIPRAIYTDPPHDAHYPARMVVLHIPSGGVKIDGVAYLAQGAGPHPTAILFVGLPGNEKNLDLAQAVRRAGWNTVSFFYRGSWGSPGVFRLSHCLEDAGLVLISAGAMGDFGSTFPHAKLVKFIADNMESLAGATPEQLTDQLQSHASQWRFDHLYGQLVHVPLIVITSDPMTASANDALVTALRTRGDNEVTAIHMNTDHSYSDHRIALESTVINWLQRLPQ